MIVANKKYLEKEEEVYPDTETFFNKKISIIKSAEYTVFTLLMRRYRKNALILQNCSKIAILTIIVTMMSQKLGMICTS